MGNPVALVARKEVVVNEDKYSTDAYAAWIGRGCDPIPLKSCEKVPRDTGWQNRVYGPDDFTGNVNVGLRLGARPDGTHPEAVVTGVFDVDNDCDEAAATARLLMPQTLVFGRAARPNAPRLVPWFCGEVEFRPSRRVAAC